MRAIFPIALALVATFSADASAAYYVTNVTMANSGYTGDYACTIQLSTSPASSTGTTYWVDDNTGRFDAICSAAAMAMYFDDDVSVSTLVSGGHTYITALASAEPGNIPSFTTHGTTATSGKDHCVATYATRSGTYAAGVDDDNPEEHVTCAALALMHFYGSASFTFSTATSGEINTVSMSY